MATILDSTDLEYIKNIEEEIGWNKHTKLLNQIRNKQIKTKMRYHFITSRCAKIKKSDNRDFPGGPVVKTSPSNARGVGSIPGQGAKIPHASWPKHQNIKQKQYCNKFNKDFKNGPHPPPKKILKKKKRQYLLW